MFGRKNKISNDKIKERLCRIIREHDWFDLTTSNNIDVLLDMVSERLLQYRHELKEAKNVSQDEHTKNKEDFPILAAENQELKAENNQLKAKCEKFIRQIECLHDQIKIHDSYNLCLSPKCANRANTLLREKAAMECQVDSIKRENTEIKKEIDILKRRLQALPCIYCRDSRRISLPSHPYADYCPMCQGTGKQFRE